MYSKVGNTIIIAIVAVVNRISSDKHGQHHKKEYQFQLKYLKSPRVLLNTAALGSSSIFKRELYSCSRFYIFVFSCSCSSAFYSNSCNFTRFRVYAFLRFSKFLDFQTFYLSSRLQYEKFQTFVQIFNFVEHLPTQIFEFSQ